MHAFQNISIFIHKVIYRTEEFLRRSETSRDRVAKTHLEANLGH